MMCFVVIGCVLTNSSRKTRLELNSFGRAAQAENEKIARKTGAFSPPCPTPWA
jgi:hypothetical protein